MKLKAAFIKYTCRKSHPVRGAWIEIVLDEWVKNGGESHPVRGAWIEIRHHAQKFSFISVAPRQGCVD